MLDMYTEISKGIVIVKDSYFSNKERQVKESKEYREKLGMDKLKQCNIMRLYEQMEMMGTNTDSIIITPITNKWKDTSKNFEGLGTEKLEMEGTLAF